MRSILVAILLVAVTPAGVARAQPAPGGADAQAEVDALIADGTRLADAGDYRRALARFDAAFARAPRATIMLKRGVVLARLERRLEAAAAFEAYLESGSADPRLVGTVEAQLARLDAALAHLTIAVDGGTPVEVQLGDGAWVVLPRGPVRVAPGSYRIAVRATDRRAEVAVAAALAARLVTRADAAGLAGAELVVGAGWVGLRSHPRPTASIVFGGPDVPPWFDAVLEEGS